MARERETISLVDDQGNEHEFDVVDVIEVQDRRYAILQPTDGTEEAVVFRVEDDETLITLEDEEEFNRVADALENLGSYDVVAVGDDEVLAGDEVADDDREDDLEDDEDQEEEDDLEDDEDQEEEDDLEDEDDLDDESETGAEDDDLREA